MSILAGKRIVVTGVVNSASIATGIAEMCRQQGAELAFTYQNDRVKPRVTELADRLGGGLCLPCDVGSDEQIEAMASALQEHWPEGLDGLVHSIAFAPEDALGGDFCDGTERESFKTAMDISAYSLIALCRALRKQLRPKSAVVTLTYHGASRLVSSYNVMGVAKAALESAVRYLGEAIGQQGHRINAVSAGPVRTAASAGVKKFRNLMSHTERRAPIKRSISAQEVGNVAAFLLSDLSSAITGATVYADVGFHTTTIKAEDIT